MSLLAIEGCTPQDTLSTTVGPSQTALPEVGMLSLAPISPPARMHLSSPQLNAHTSAAWQDPHCSILGLPHLPAHSMVRAGPRERLLSTTSPAQQPVLIPAKVFPSTHPLSSGTGKLWEGRRFEKMRVQQQLWDRKAKGKPPNAAGLPFSPPHPPLTHGAVQGQLFPQLQCRAKAWWGWGGGDPGVLQQPERSAAESSSREPFPRGTPPSPCRMTVPDPGRAAPPRCQRSLPAATGHCSRIGGRVCGPSRQRGGSEAAELRAAPGTPFPPPQGRAGPGQSAERRSSVPGVRPCPWGHRGGKSRFSARPERKDETGGEGGGRAGGGERGGIKGSEGGSGRKGRGVQLPAPGSWRSSLPRPGR